MRIPWSKFLFGAAEDKLEPYIPVDQEIIQRIKSAVAQAEPGTALEILQELDIPAIEPDVLAVAGRYNHLETAQRRGIVSAEEQQLQFNRLNHDLLDLAARLEKSLEPDKVLRQIKVNLRKRYQQRLKDKLADRQPINIQCAYTIEGTDPERAKIAYDEIVLEQKAVQSNLEALFDRHRGRLLITGDPGAGKTSLLLQLADALLKRRENRVPVILNLSTWKSSYPSFDAWLLEALPQAAYVSKAMAKTLVLEDRLLPLFDGLDEVAAEHRNSCLAGIARYGRVAAHQYVICSRSAEYAETAGAPVYGQIKVLPLTQAQIVQQLENSTQPEARFLLHALRNQPLLARVVENPFYFNTAQLLLSSMTSLEELQIRADNEEELQAGLVEQFVERQLATPARVDFPVEKSRRWLGFLAKRMEENGLVVFELTDLRLGWINNKLLYFLFSLAPITIASCFDYKFIETIIGIFLFGAIWSVFFYKSFNTYETLYWSWDKVKIKFKATIIKFIIGVAIFFINIFYIIIPYNVKLDLHTGQYHISSIIGIILFVLVVLLMLGNIFFVLLYGFIIALFETVLGDFSVVFILIFTPVYRIINSGIGTKRTMIAKNPYQRILSTLQTEILFLVPILAFLNLVGLSERFTTGRFLIENISTLILFLPFTLLFRHVAVQLVCTIKNKLPINLSTFLNEMTARHLFESDGGSWRFRHKIVQDYFVRRYGSR